jgi:hypothetical protein
MKKALLFSAFALLAAPGCAENDITLVITEFSKIDPTNMCVVMGTSASVTVSQGVLDVGVISLFPASFGYVVAPVVQNNLTERSSQTTTERDQVQITGFDVELQPAPGGPALPVFSGGKSTKFFAPSAGGAANPGGNKVIAVAEVLPHAYAVDLVGWNALSTGGRAPVIAHMRPVGTRAGGTITGGWADFPINVCVGCLTGEINPCPAVPFKSSDVAQSFCFIGQDFPVTCCSSSDAAGAPITLCGKSVPQSM